MLREGENKKRPFTICIVANPVLEVAWDSGDFITDPLVRDRRAFDAAAEYIENVLFGRLPGQAESFLGAEDITRKVRVVSLHVEGLPADSDNSLVAQDDVSRMLVARRSAIVPFLDRYDLRADVVYAVSQSET
ncbi:MAG TPA: hypothetical protein VFQ39_07480, partial [Longimicrobium sp.]|nr:hypothetical protein [Longimicrobium sp.]